MASSHEIAQTMMAQQAMFTNMSSYSRQIGTPQTIGSFGAPPTAAPPPQVPFMPPPQAPFSYSQPSMLGYGGANQMGNQVMGAMGGAATFGMMAIPALGGLAAASSSKLMRGAGMAMDPLSAMWGAGKVARGAGMGIMGSVGVGAMAALPAAAVLGAGAFATNQMMSGAREQGQVQNVLGGMNFTNPSARGGRGFSRQASSAISSMVREMQEVPEMMTSMGELTRIMDKLVQTGSMHGARDITSFKSKFKEAISTLKDVARVMGSTMEEALPFFQEARQSGFFTKQDILRNAMNRQITGGLTGMTQGQVGAVQAGGSMQTFAMGGNRKAGAQMALRTSQRLGMERELGMMSEERLMELTGAQGAEGISRLTQTLGRATMKLSRSSLGQALAMATGEMKDGRFTGQVDEEMAEKVRSGSMGRAQIMSLARQRTGSREARLSFAAKRNQISTNTAAALGDEGIALQLKGILGERGYKDPNAMRIALQHMGIDEREAGVITERLQGADRRDLEMGVREQTERIRIGQSSYIKENFSLGAVKRRLSKRIENVLKEPFKKMGADLDTFIKTTIEEGVDDLLDRRKMQISQEMSNMFAGAMGGNRESRRKMLQQVTAGGGGLEGGTYDFTKGSGLMRTMLGGLLTGGGGVPASVSRARQIEGLENRPGEFLMRGTRAQLTAQGAESILGEARDVAGGVTLDTNATLAAFVTFKPLNPNAKIGPLGSKMMVGLRKGVSAEVSARASAIASGKWDENAQSVFATQKGKAALDRVTKEFESIMSSKGPELSEMGELERKRAIQAALRENPDYKYLTGEGVNPDTIVAAAQKDTIYEGAPMGVNFKLLAGRGELMMNATQRARLADNKKQAAKDLAKAFGEQEGAVLAILEGDSGSKKMLLAAMDDKSVANALQSGKASEELLEKYDMDQGQFEELSKTFRASRGADLKAAGKLFGGYDVDSSAEALKTQLRDQGRLISKRAEGLTGEAKELVSGFSRTLRGDDPIGEVIDSGIMEDIAGLTGEGQQTAAAKALGPAGVQALRKFRQISKMNLRGFSTEAKAKKRLDVMGITEEHLKRVGLGGITKDGIDEDERGKLAKAISALTLGGGLARKGGVEVGGIQERMIAEMDKFVKTNTTFAQVVLNAVGDKKVGEAVQKIMEQANKGFTGETEGSQ